MPHFIIETNTEYATEPVKKELLRSVLQASIDSNLFKIDDIKIRINICSEYLVGDQKRNFVHVWGYLLKGRTALQKNTLAKSLLKEVSSNVPSVTSLSINIDELSESGYCKM